MKLKKIVFLAILTALCAGHLYSQQGSSYIIGHITISTGLINDYPADSVNWFYRKKHKVVQYFAYFLFPSASEAINFADKQYLFINPFEIYPGRGKYAEEDNYVFENRWVSPSGKVICEKVVAWTKVSSDKRVSVDNRQYIPYAFANYIGISEILGKNGQEKLPAEKGLYHVNLYLNGELAAVTFFEMKD